MLFRSNTSSTYYFWTNDKDFYNQNLISQSTIATTLGTADNTPLYTALVDLFPTTIVKRYKVFLDENSDSLNQLKTIDTGKYRNDRGYEFLYVTLDSNQLESGEIPVDSTASVYSDYWEENYSYQNGFSLESSYKRYYNNINEMLDVVNPDLPRMEHVSFVGGSLIFNEGRKDGNYNAYKLNYHQTYGVESMNTLWGQVLGFQIDGGFYANRFMNLSLLTNYTWGELTYSKLPTGGDNFVVNPQRMYQITNSFFTIGTGLNVKIKLSALYLVATGGYQWDISDGRWNYEGEYINSIGKLKMNGGYFELGVGFNVK